jgi:hypothetical protein
MNHERRTAGMGFLALPIVQVNGWSMPPDVCVWEGERGRGEEGGERERERSKFNCVLGPNFKSTY